MVPMQAVVLVQMAMLLHILRAVHHLIIIYGILPAKPYRMQITWFMEFTLLQLQMQIIALPLLLAWLILVHFTPHLPRHSHRIMSLHLRMLPLVQLCLLIMNGALVMEIMVIVRIQDRTPTPMQVLIMYVYLLWIHRIIFPATVNIAIP